MERLTGVVCDSTVVIDHLNDITVATNFLASADQPTISVITWIEVVAGLRTPDEESRGRRLLDSLDVVPLSDGVAEEAVQIRRATGLKLPDAIILATARHLGYPLVTRNTKDFDRDDPSILVPYEL